MVESCTRVGGGRQRNKLEKQQLLNNRGLKWEWKP